MSGNSIENTVRVVIVGSGNVAETFARNLVRCEGVALRQIFARNAERGRAVAEEVGVSWSNDPASLAEADIYVIAVSDRAVGEVAASLHLPDNAILVHTAGSVPMDVLPKRGGLRGIFYAFQSFTQGRDISLSDVPIFIEAERDDVREALTLFAQRITSRVEYADSERRRVIHLAGVFVNNFVNALYGVGSDVVESTGLTFDILKPLILETASKAVASASPRSVQTGPAVRGDMAVCEKHLLMLAENQQLQRIYNELTQHIWETSKRI